MADYSLIDLHTHTVHSHEGGCDDKVEKVLEEAQIVAARSGKDALVSITDHNTILGTQEAYELLRSGKYPNVKLLSGCEFTVTLDEINQELGGRVFGNCHILAYGFDPYDPALTEYSKKRGGVMGGKLGFSKFAEMIKNAGGHLVIAHPGLIKVFPKSLINYRGSEFNEELQGIAQSGRSSKTILRYVRNGEYLLELLYKKLNEKSGGLVVGMERFHPDNYSYGFDKNIGKICEKYGLAQTTGSDYHGEHLHTEFSVGNGFTENFQEFYKKAIQDSSDCRNGLYISHLPRLELLTNEKPSNDKEIRMITAHGETVTYEQYNQVNDAFDSEMRRRKQDAASSRYSESGKKGSRDSNYHSGNHGGNNKKKKHKNKKKHHGKKRTIKYYETSNGDEMQNENQIEEGSMESE